MSLRTGTHHIYYITATLWDGTAIQSKQVALSSRTAILNCMRDLQRDDVRSISTTQGIPKSKARRDAHRKRSQAAKARHKREREEAFMWSRGTESIADPTKDKE